MELDPEQRAVVDAGPEERLLVVAGAGRGKTEVVAARIAAFESEHGLAPADDVLVLSFSRAAVRAVSRRLADTSNAAVCVSTFDSYAARVLLDADDDPSEHRGFDARIRAATAILRRGDAVDIELIRHLVLDEVQDLVGDRAEFALALIENLESDTGFTALGDPLQAIYDWQLDKAGSTTSSNQLMAQLVGRHGAREVALTTDYRARGDDPKAVVGLGDDVREQTVAEQARGRIADFIWNLYDLGPLKNSANLVRRPGASTVVLCRTNGEALTVARLLRDNEIAHALRRQMEDVGGAAWIASAFRSAKRDTLEESEVRDLLAMADVEVDLDEAWSALKTAERDRRSRPDQLRLAGLRRTMRARALPLDLMTQDSADVVVSTIHRAKGLEFDRVVLVDRKKARDDEDDWVEARTDYVALSRARDDLFRCQTPWSSLRKHRSGRWTAYSKKKWPYAMEVTSADTDNVRPTQDETGDASSVQLRLAEALTLGAEVYGQLDKASDIDCPRYLLRTAHDELVIGRSSEQFGLDMVRVFGPRRGVQTWPATVRDLHVAAVESVAGDPNDTRSAGLGVSGIWLVARFGGMARPEFPKKAGTA